MRTSEIIGKALAELKANSSLLSCTLCFILLTVLTSCAEKFVSELFLLIRWGNVYYAYYPALLLSGAVFYTINFQFAASFIYMIIKGKTRFKRHFSFLHIKYLKFFLLNTAVFYPPYRICYVLCTKYHYAALGKLPAVIGAVAAMLQLGVIYFKAADHRRSFPAAFKVFFTFLKENFKRVLLLHFSF